MASTVNDPLLSKGSKHQTDEGKLKQSQNSLRKGTVFGYKPWLQLMMSKESTLTPAILTGLKLGQQLLCQMRRRKQKLLTQRLLLVVT